MKKSILFTIIMFLCCQLFSAKFQISDSLIIEGELISSSANCSIVAVKENNVVVYYVLSEIANALLPEAVKQVCLIVVGHENQEICEALSEGVEFVTSVRDVRKGVFKLAKSAGILYAERGSTKSLFRFTANSLELAYNIKNTIDAYEKLKLLLWHSTDNFYVKDPNDVLSEVTINNVSTETAVMEISHDGITWAPLTIFSGKSMKLRRYLPAKENYLLVKGLNCNYQIYSAQTYKIYYSKNMFYLMK